MLGKEQEMSKIFEIFGNEPHEMTKALMKADSIAEQIPKGASIALKPNLVHAGRPRTERRPMRRFFRDVWNISGRMDLRTFP